MRKARGLSMADIDVRFCPSTRSRRVRITNSEVCHMHKKARDSNNSLVLPAPKLGDRDCRTQDGLRNHRPAFARLNGLPLPVNLPSGGQGGPICRVGVLHHCDGISSRRYLGKPCKEGKPVTPTPKS